MFLLLIHSLILSFLLLMFSVSSLISNLRRLWTWWSSFYCSLKGACVLTPCLDILFCLCYTTSSSTSCWEFAYKQLKNNCYMIRMTALNPSNCHPVTLLSYFWKAFKEILNRKGFRHLSTFNLVLDHQHKFHNGCSTGDLFFSTDSWSFILS